MDITGKVFVVTGAGSGMGRSVVLELLTRGATIAAVDLNPDALTETVSLAKTPAERLSTHVANIADKDRVAALPGEITAIHGHVDGIFNIAGIIQPFVPISDLDLATIEKVMAVNFWGTVYTTTAFLPLLKQRPEAVVLNVSSMGGLVPVPGQSAYGASKGAVKLFTEGLYAENQDSNLHVTLVFPGAVETNISVNSGVGLPSTGNAEASQHKMTSSADAAKQMVDAVASNTFRVRIGSDAKLLDRLVRVAPTKAITMIADKMKDLLSNK